MLTKTINAKVILRNLKIPLGFSSDSIISKTSPFTNFYMEQYFASEWYFRVSKKNTTRNTNHVLKIYCLSRFFKIDSYRYYSTPFFIFYIFKKLYFSSIY